MAEMRGSNLLNEMEAIYERYGKPLEAEHRGEFVVITRQGDYVLGRTRLEAAQQAAAQFGLENFMFKVGERSVGRIR